MDEDSSEHAREAEREESLQAPAPPSTRDSIDALPPPQKRPRGPRTPINQEQYAMLKAVYEKTPQPSKQVREKLAAATELSNRVVQVTFQLLLILLRELPFHLSVCL